MVEENKHLFLCNVISPDFQAAVAIFSVALSWMKADRGYRRQDVKPEQWDKDTLDGNLCIP